jgi:outer membrane protein assembly factor BamA
VDSIATVGNQRVTRTDMLSRIGIQPGEVSPLDIQRAERNLWASGDFRDIQVDVEEVATPAGPRVVLTFEVDEQPLLRDVTIAGLENVSERRVRDSTGLTGNVPYSPQTVTAAQAFIRSELAKAGIPFARIEERLIPVSTGTGEVVDLILDVTEGNRVTVADLVIEGNEAIDDETITAALTTRPEA